MDCNTERLTELNDRQLDALFLKTIRLDDGAAVREHLEAGRPVYYCDDNFPDEMIREWPDRSRELVVHVGSDSEVIVVACLISSLK